ncbi:MAG: hypothetical protein ACOZEN_09860 [Thermodesulfobacteriota bacterium]
MKTTDVIPAAMAAAILAGSIALPGRAAAQDFAFLLPFLLFQGFPAASQPPPASPGGPATSAATLYKFLITWQPYQAGTCPACATPYTPLDPGMSNK